MDRVSRRALPVLAAALALSCAHPLQLVPAPGAPVEPGSRGVVQQTVEGVRVQVDPGAWRGRYLQGVLSPVLVRIENGSPRALRIAWPQFTLSAGRFQAQALPPFHVAVQSTPVAVAPYYPWSGYWLEPWEARFYQPGAPVWSGPLAYEPGYYAAWGPGWPPVLPDEDVLRRALPEGVADPGGSVAGFLYFPERPKGTAVVFDASLVDARSNEVFGKVEIPFVVK